MDALGIFELGAKAGRAYVRAIRQAYRDALAGDPESDYYASRLGVAEEGGEALEPAPLEHRCDCGLSADMDDLDDHAVGCIIWDDPTCYFCGDVTNNVVTTDDDDTEFVCEQCADDELGNYPPMPRNYEKCGDCGNDMIMRHVCTPPAADAPPQVPSSSAGRGVGSPGVSAGAEEPAPPGKRADVAVGAIVAEVLAEHQAWLRTTDDGYNGRVYCYGAYFGDDCAPHAMYDDQRAWREHVAPLIAAAVGVGATPTPKPAEPTTFPCVVTGCMSRFNNFTELNTHSYWTHLEPDPFKTNEDPLVRYERYPGASPAGDFKWFSIKVTYPKSKAQK